MSRLIDADAYADEMRKRQDECLKWIIETKDIKEKNYTINDIALHAMATFSEAKLTLDKQPTVNHEDIVRCKDCKHFNNPDKCFIEYLCRLKNADRSIMNGFMVSNWYCAGGERKDDGKNREDDI